MSSLRPKDRVVLATAVVDSIVVAADPDARKSGLYYWELARPWTQAVVEAVLSASDPAIRSLGERLVADPGDASRYAELHAVLVDGERVVDAKIFERAWLAECNSRVGYHYGPRHGVDEISTDELKALPPGTPMPEGASPEVLVVVPFRDRTPGADRMRNLLACLLALRDQSFPRELYQVTVVESDDQPRWRDVITPFADRYLFAPKPGSFNKSWAVNAGVVNTGGTTEVVCILDADVLVDRDFVARNAARFQRPGVGGHLTYRNMFCVTEDSTSWGIRERVWRGAAEADPTKLRGFLLRRPPGCCLWVRSGTFGRIGGMDERYEGWGGEDNDFAYRFDIAAPFDSYDDVLLHMHHPPASLLRDDGELVNAHIPALSWRPTEPIGRLDRFVSAQPLGVD